METEAPALLTARQRIEQIDNKLFDAGVAALHANTKRDREYVDRLITDARVKLEQLRSYLT